MMDFGTLKNEVLDRLKPLGLDKVILFGSYANGTFHPGSDLDLYVVTKDDYVPKSWREKNQLYLKVSRALRDLREQTPIDLIVHTRKMHEAFRESNGSFYRHDISNGILLI